jgi:hypothetical protein
MGLARRAHAATVRIAVVTSLSAIGLLCVLALPEVSPSAAADTSGTSPGPTSLTPMDVVGDPVAGEGAAAAVTVDRSHNLHLVGVAPDTGRVVWSKPFSESLIDPGLPPALDPLGNEVIDLVPAVKVTNPLVNVDAVNMTTGAVAWVGPRDVLVGDVPSPCVHMTEFCVTVYDEDGSSTTAILSPDNGSVVGLLKGASNALDYDLYQTDAKTPTIEAVSGSGNVQWTRTTNEIFGGAGYDPYVGTFTSYGTTEVVTVPPPNTDHSDGLDNATTVGLSLADGGTMWSLPGQYDCDGSLGLLVPAFNCVYTGFLARSKSNANGSTYAGLQMSLQGFDPATGAVTWTVPVRDIDDLTNGDAEFVDDNSLLVQLGGGESALLDTSDGKTEAVPPGQVFWCVGGSTFKVNENKSVNKAENRPEADRYYPCKENGATSPSWPSTSPDQIGITVDGEFMWATAHGLARRSVGPAQGTA